MKVHGSFMAVLCYLVTVLLLYLTGDIFNISILQLAKEPLIQNGVVERILHSLLPFLLAIPVYFIVYYKTKEK
ncbi:hypothetical protein [Ectobacillus sp. sgz5001026]|uniref:hypothetical protein n=1 Tax=Ectobacillus sp. sgz5001026 TaxID=3242473 RepID=UPI0036D21E1C